MMLRRLSVLTLLFLGLGSGGAWAIPVNQSPRIISQNPQEKPGLGMERIGREGKFIEQLNLTADQKQKIAAIRGQYKTQIDSQSQTMRKVAQELQTMMTNGTDPNQLRQKHEQLMELRQQLQKLRFNSFLEIQQVLTPEQRTQLSQLMQQRHQNRPRRGGGNPNFNPNQ